MIKSDLPTTKTTSRLRQKIKFNIETSFKPDHIYFITDGCLDSNSCVRRVGTSAERLPPSAFFRLMATNLISPGSHNNNIINIINNNNSTNYKNSNRASWCLFRIKRPSTMSFVSWLHFNTFVKDETRAGTKEATFLEKLSRLELTRDEKIDWAGAEVQAAQNGTTVTKGRASNPTKSFSWFH